MIALPIIYSASTNNLCFGYLSIESMSLWPNIYWDIAVALSDVYVEQIFSTRLISAGRNLYEMPGGVCWMSGLC